MIKIPGLIDVHVHMREPGAEHKEDWDSGSAAALAGGFTTVLAMPNTQPPVFDVDTLDLALNRANAKSRCDFAQYIGAGPENAESASKLAYRTAGLKMYLDMTYGNLRLDDMRLWLRHFEKFPTDIPIVAHAESRTLAAVILLADLFNRPVHLAHVSTEEEIVLIRKAKERGIKITCEVTPHHLFLSTQDIPHLGSGRSEVRPRLASPTDQAALWDNLEFIDCFATDHAPHTLAEKDSQNPPPGFPGLETALPLLLTAVHAGRLTLDDLIQRMYSNPRRIFTLPDQAETWTEIEPDALGTIQAGSFKTRCGWTPFEGFSVRGQVSRVVLRGKEAFKDGAVLTEQGYGQNVRFYQ